MTGRHSYSRDHRLRDTVLMTIGGVLIAVGLATGLVVGVLSVAFR